MANHKSAKKRARQALKRRDRNREVKSAMRTAIKSVRTSVEAGDAAKSTTDLRLAERLLRKAAGKGVIPKRRASRQISRLAKQQNKVG